MEKTKTIIVTSKGEGFDEALLITENLGKESELSHKEVLHLRLLAEEVFGVMRSIAGDIQAEYWIEHEGKNFSIHVKSDVMLTQEMRKKFLSVSSEGENASAKGFMGKIKDMIGVMLLPKESGASMLTIGLMSLGDPGGLKYDSETYNWSMNQYKSGIENGRNEDESAADAWDELEKSIVANIADEIEIHINGAVVEITIDKKF